MADFTAAAGLLLFSTGGVWVRVGDHVFDMQSRSKVVAVGVGKGGLVGERPGTRSGEERVGPAGGRVMENVFLREGGDEFG